jgi:hypothetical protein
MNAPLVESGPFRADRPLVDSLTTKGFPIDLRSPTASMLRVNPWRTDQLDLMIAGAAATVDVGLCIRRDTQAAPLTAREVRLSKIILAKCQKK